MKAGSRSQKPLTENRPLPATASWLAGLIGLIILAFSLSIAAMLAY